MSTSNVTIHEATNHEGTKIGFVGLPPSDKNEKIKHLLYRNAEYIKRRLLNPTTIKDISIGQELIYTNNNISDCFQVQRIGFPPHSKKTDIVFKASVLNETKQRIALTTDDIEFTFDGKKVKWKPQCVCDILELDPDQGVFIKGNTINGSNIDNKNALFKVAKIVPMMISKNSYQIYYKIQDTWTIKNLVLRTIEHILTDYESIINMVHKNKDSMLLNYCEIDMTAYEKSLSDFIKYIGIGDKYQGKIVVQYNFQPPTSILLKVKSKKTNVYDLMLKLIQDAKEYLFKLEKEIKSTTPVKSTFDEIEDMRERFNKMSDEYFEKTKPSM